MEGKWLWKPAIFKEPDKDAKIYAGSHDRAQSFVLRTHAMVELRQ